MTPILKDPQASLDYKWDWDLWLEEGEKIVGVALTVPEPLVLDEANSGITDDGRSVTAWLSGGTATTKTTVTCLITTDSAPPRIDARRMNIVVTGR